MLRLLGLLRLPLLLILFLLLELLLRVSVMRPLRGLRALPRALRGMTPACFVASLHDWLHL